VAEFLVFEVIILKTTEQTIQNWHLRLRQKTLRVLKVLSLHVKNSGALQDIKIDFTNHGQAQSVIVLGGANGSGKTTILELIFALAELFKLTHPDKYELSEILKRTEFAEMELLIDHQKQKVCFQRSSFSPTTHTSAGITFQVDENTAEFSLQHSPLTEQINRLITLTQDKPIALSHEATAIPAILYFPHNRELLSVVGEQIHREEVKYQWCYRYTSSSNFPGSLESYLIWLDYAEPELFQMLIDFLNQLDFEGKTFQINRKKLSVVVKTPQGNQHALDQLSSGEKNILIMLVELRRRLIPGSMVLIDEIENSLHPAFQHRLAQHLLQLQRQIPFQLILTTHQPTFVKIFGEDCTRILTEF